ncbi:MAG: hypothetical protein GTO18_18340 [Anaerolineales bacterium]|nr:hypothetical protein [Anaerolineales bacterium]
MSESTLDELQGHHKEELVSYKPSWFDRLQDNVDCLPGPSWLIYALFGVLLLGIDVLISWTESNGGELVIDPISILIIFQITYIFIFLDYLDKQAVKALKSLRPSLSVNSTLFERLKYQISTLPARQTLLISIISLMLASGLIMMDQLQPETEPSDMSFTSVSFGIYTMVVFSMVWMMNAIFLYHTYRQLKSINHIYTKHTNINLFHQSDLYAFSGFSAQTAIGLVLPGLP